jgi:hypothetical protein
MGGGGELAGVSPRLQQPKNQKCDVPGHQTDVLD